MPLDAERETPAGALGRLGPVVDGGAAGPVHALAEPGDALGGAVEGGGAGPEGALPEPVDALVVMAFRHVDPLPRRTRGQRARVEVHVVVGVGERADRAAVLAVADEVGQMLVQRAAERDV